MKYRTKPFEIEAVQFTGDNLMEIIDFADTNIDSIVTPDSVEHKVYDYQHDTWIKFGIGDYIVKGMNGEFYPCVADVFEAKYAPAYANGGFYGGIDKTVDFDE
jgi:hypothetical protein